MNRTNTNAMDIDEYRKIKESLKTLPINKQTATELGRGTTTLATIKKSKSFKHYKELRKLNRGKKKSVQTVNAEPVHIDVKKLGRLKRIAVIRHEALYAEGDMVFVPAALFEALSDQMTELSKELEAAKVFYAAPQMYISTDKGEPFEEPTVSFKERLTAKVNQIRKRWNQ